MVQPHLEYYVRSGDVIEQEKVQKTKMIKDLVNSPVEKGYNI